MSCFALSLSLVRSLRMTNENRNEKKENHQLVHLARVRYELMIRLILTLGSSRNEHIIISRNVDNRSINQAEPCSTMNSSDRQCHVGLERSNGICFCFHGEKNVMSLSCTQEIHFHD